MDRPKEAEGWPGSRVTRVPWRQLSAKAALMGQAGFLRGNLKGTRPSVALAGSEAQGPPRPIWSRRQALPGRAHSHHCNQARQILFPPAE